MGQLINPAVRVLLGGVALGIWGDALLRARPWGLNVALWTVGLLVVAALLGRKKLSQRPWPWLGLAFFFALCVAWRDSSTLFALDLALALAALAVGAWVARGWAARGAGLMQYGLAAATATFDGAFGAGSVLPNCEVDWEAMGANRWKDRLRAVTVGLLLSVPLLFVFGALLSGADDVFKTGMRRFFDLQWLDPETAVPHVAAFAIVTWFATGYLRTLFLRDKDPDLSAEVPAKLRFGAIEVGLPLGLLSLLFLAFVLVQAVYLFGSSQFVVVTPGLTYSDYATEGFFHLVLVIALVLPMLLGADWLLRKDEPAAVRAFRVLGSVQLVLVAVIMLSAFWRLGLYIEAYGLTEDRFYGGAFLMWLGVLLCWFAATVLRGQRHRFAFGMLATGFAGAALLNVVNPDAAIARVNLARVEAGKRLDAAHLARLSADAVPVVLRALPKLDPYNRDQVIGHFQDAWSVLAAQPNAEGSDEAGHRRPDRLVRYADGDWRSWNWSRDFARAEYVARQKTWPDPSHGLRSPLRLGDAAPQPPHP